ncbi:unnamed protein product [Rhizoctonia solani]|uniref:RRM domain-containing protein n=1 Tax=Rhizoctonia solani TaxID=456999 RepID=A0A8H3DAV4_9AGAM|nr:unnamed protein product [Rhizoctonia solani]
MTHLLPPNLLKLFSPRPPLPFVRSVGRDPDKVRSKNVSGVAGLLAQVREDNERGIVGAGASQVEREEGEEERYTYAEEIKRTIAREQKQMRKKEEFQKAKETYKPADDSEALGDPYKTLFISRLSKNATEDDLRKEFGTYGRIERIRLVKNKRGASRGYAFIVYDREKDMKAAYKEADGIKLCEDGNPGGWVVVLEASPPLDHMTSTNSNQVDPSPLPPSKSPPGSVLRVEEIEEVEEASEATGDGADSGVEIEEEGSGGVVEGLEDEVGMVETADTAAIEAEETLEVIVVTEAEVVAVGTGEEIGGTGLEVGTEATRVQVGTVVETSLGVEGMDPAGKSLPAEIVRRLTGSVNRGRGGGIGFQGGFSQQDGAQSGGYGGAQDNGYPPKRGYDDGADRDSKRTRY